MAQYCTYCKWYSADGLAFCSTCGAEFALQQEEEEEEVEERPLFERIGWGLALIAGALFGSVFVYRRYIATGALAPATAALVNGAASLQATASGFYTWLIGPNGEYRDFVVIALLVTAFLWLVLWVMARLNRASR